MKASFRVIAATCLLMLFGSAHASDLVFRNGFDPGFQIQTPDITVAPGAEEIWCYYFRTPNTDVAGVRRWASLMQPGMAHFIVYAAYSSSWQPIEMVPPGTLTQTPCGLGTGSTLPGWLYSTYAPAEQMVFPDTDGSGSPVAAELQAGQPVFLQMFVSNSGTAPLTTSALLEAETLGTDRVYTKTASYLALNTNIAIPAMGSASVTATCVSPPFTSFWWLSTRTHRFATQSKISDGSTTLVVSDDWAHPTIAQFSPANFHAFPSNGITHDCSYVNPTANVIQYGESETTDETCMSIGFFFPAAHPAICYNGSGPF